LDNPPITIDRSRLQIETAYRRGRRGWVGVWGQVILGLRYICAAFARHFAGLYGGAALPQVDKCLVPVASDGAFWGTGFGI